MSIKRALSFVLIGIIGLALMVSIMAYGIHRALKPDEITWDFTHGSTIAAVGWPPTLSGTDYERYDVGGNIHLRIIGETGKCIFDEHIFHFWCERQGNNLKFMAIHFSNKVPAEITYVHAKNIMTQWAFHKRNFDALDRWHDSMSKGLYFDETFETIKAGNVALKISMVGDQRAERLNCGCCLTLTF